MSSSVLFLSLAGFASAGGPGSTAFDFLSIDVGPRQTAMGGAAAAVADDLFGANANPAALGRLWRQEVSALYTQWFQDVNYQYLGYAYPNLNLGTFSASLYNLDFGGIQGYDASGAQTQTLSANDRMVNLSYGRPITENLTGGMSLKYIREILNTTSANAFATDLGLLCQLPSLGALQENYAGLSLRNLGNSPKFINQKSPLPLILDMGLSVRPFFQSLTFAYDLTKTQTTDVSSHIGIEYWAHDIIGFRIGYNSAYDIGTGLAFGFGLKAWNIQVDYAFADYGDLGGTHRMSFTYRFGSVAENIYAQGMKYMRQEDYARAIIEFSRALAVDPKNERTILRIKEANERLQHHFDQLKP